MHPGNLCHTRHLLPETPNPFVSIIQCERLHEPFKGWRARDFSRSTHRPTSPTLRRSSNHLPSTKFGLWSSHQTALETKPTEKALRFPEIGIGSKTFLRPTRRWSFNVHLCELALGLCEVRHKRKVGNHFMAIDFDESETMDRAERYGLNRCHLSAEASSYLSHSQAYLWTQRTEAEHPQPPIWSINERG